MVKNGVLHSSAYLLFTVGNKCYMDLVFEKFKKAGVSYDRFSSQPTILNTILWYAVAESDTQYHLTLFIT